jgi:hypothetical protein
MRRAGTSALNTNIANIASSSPYSRPQSPAVMGGAPMARTGTAGTGKFIPLLNSHRSYLEMAIDRESCL